MVQIVDIEQGSRDLGKLSCSQWFSFDGKEEVGMGADGTLGKPKRMMTLGCTKSETQWIYFLSHTPPLLYILRHVTSVDFFLYIHPVFFKHQIEFDARVRRLDIQKDCLKAYHPQCVGKEDSFSETEESWTFSMISVGIYVGRLRKMLFKLNSFSWKGVMESNLTSTKREFIGWGSKVLMEFLASIGEDTTKKLSKDEVTSIINRYIHENNLFDQKNKMKVLIDERLLPVLGRKSVNRYRINNIVDIHLAENLDQSEQDESGFGSKDKSENVIVTYRRQRKLSSNKPLIKELVRGILQSQFAAIVPKNLKLVFLKRSLVLELLKQPDSFQRKIRGSFVKVKSGAHLYSHHLSYQLFQVIGVKKASKTGEIDSEILLQAPLAKDIHIDMLVEHDLTKEECEEYRQKVKYGFYKRPTIVEFEEKARSLHEDITKHWIKKELSRLQNLIDRANEKGCRSEYPLLIYCNITIYAECYYRMFML
ncbi:unnamed protein product, partial [Vitis vinifera]